jgi:hypothetical protein
MTLFLSLSLKTINFGKILLQCLMEPLGVAQSMKPQRHSKDLPLSFDITHCFEEFVASSSLGQICITAQGNSTSCF